MTGYAAVADAADRAVLPPTDDEMLSSILRRDQEGGPVGDPDEPCPSLLRALDDFLEDPITVAYGLADMGDAVARGHVRSHMCQGMGRA